MTDHPAQAVPGGPGERPLRRDAERNRRRILTAATAVFTEHGLDATLDEVARAAGVGVGTVYRRFPDKRTLIAELFVDRIDALAAAAEQACASADPWQGLASYLEFAASTMAGDLGLRQLMMSAAHDAGHVCQARERLAPVLTRLVERAQAAGVLRPDIRATDLKLMMFMLSTVAEYSCAVTPDVWRRYLTVLIDGLRPARDSVSEMPVPAPTPDEFAELARPHGRRPSPRR